MKQVLIFLIAIDLLSCRADQEQEQELYYPSKDAQMEEGIYQKYKSKLDTAYAHKNFFEAGVQLSNLTHFLNMILK